jgi:hypothetical protein
MLARLRARLTYANVVATLALFVALGGSAYAAHQITSRDIRNRSIRAVDVSKNALGGTEIKESKLKAVPRALAATNAVSAVNATNAGLADVAKNANNAGALGGQGAGFFEKSSKTQFGRAPADPAAASGEQAVLDWPAMGVQLTTGTPGGIACASNRVRIAVKNTKASGPSVEVLEAGGGGTVAAANKGYFCSQTTGNVIHTLLSDSTGRTLFADCMTADGELRCVGIRSEP